MAEYSTEEDLFYSLQDGKIDKAWLFACKENGTEREFKIVKVLDVLPIIGVETASDLLVRKRRKKVQGQFTECLNKWAKNKNKKQEEEEEEQEEEQEEEEEALLNEVASNILDETSSESKKPEQVRQIISH